jgi:HAD superfamily hydrolase (TIGR01509 family)
LGAADLIIFDCDGVLVDSEPIAIAVLRRFLNDIGLPVTEEETYRTFLGRSWSAVERAVETARGRPLSEAETTAFRRDLFGRFRTDLRPMPGVFATLDALRDWRYCVASSSIPERLNLTLDVTGLAPRFAPHIFSASMVSRGKPAPDLLLLAAESMGVEPRRCVVVEDSPIGIEAARAAGMGVVAFLGGGHVRPGRLAAAAAALSPDATIDRLADLPLVLAGWEARMRQAPGIT